jgi:hypothetical protein
MNHSDYIIFVDESGDHGLIRINPQFPIFVLAFCIIRKADYADQIVPALQKLKFRWFGHDLPVLHEMDIAKRKGPFSFLQNSKLFGQFMDELSAIMADAPMTVIASVIDKRKLSAQYRYPMNPYDIALLFCLERSCDYLSECSAIGGPTHIIVESRSPKMSGHGREDAELRQTFDLIVNGIHDLASKQTNSIGLQLADLVARPIGLSVLRAEQPNRAFDIIRQKIWRHEETGKGLKLFP